MSFPRLRNALIGLAVIAAVPATALAQPTQTLGGLIKAMADTLAGAPSLTVHVEKAFDDVLVTGEKLQYSGAVDITLRRPDAFHLDYSDDLSALETWYDGKHVILVDHRAGVFGQLEAKDTIDATLANVAKEYGLYMPLAGLISTEAYTNFVDKVERLAYIGLHDVGGVAAHHVYFSDGNVSWQLWIDAGAVPLPLKLVVTRDDLPGAPQTMFWFSDWNLAANLPADVFVPKIPEGAALAAFLPIKGE